MFCYGDVHGDWDWLKRVVAKQPVGDTCAIQVGDFGVGFPPESRQDFAYVNVDNKTFPPVLPNTFGFIPGNHDDPDLCKQHPNCLGDFGYLEDGDIFFIRGASSIDRNSRTIGIDWWENEELSYQELEQMIELYSTTKPKYVVSHTCPASLFEIPMLHSHLLGSIKRIDRTSEAMQIALQQHAPAKWLFGHFHCSDHCDIGITRFYVIGINQRIELPGVSFKLP